MPTPRPDRFVTRRAVEKPGRQLADVADVLDVDVRLGRQLGTGEALGEQPGVVAEDLGVVVDGAQVLHQNRPHVAHVPGDEDPHAWPPSASLTRRAPARGTRAQAYGPARSCRCPVG